MTFFLIILTLVFIDAHSQSHLQPIQNRPVTMAGSWSMWRKPTQVQENSTQKGQKAEEKMCLWEKNKTRRGVCVCVCFSEQEMGQLKGQMGV